MRSAYGLAAFLFVAAWVALSSPWLTGTYTIPYDAKAHFQAQIQFLANALHTGESPFWLPHVFAGSPQIADPQSLIFSPAFLLAWADPTPSFRLLDGYVLVLVGAAGIAVLAYFRDRGWHAAGALVAALSVAFGASAAWRIQHIGQIKSYACFWIVLFLLSRSLHRRSLGYGVAAGLVAGVMLAEPDQVALLACYLLAGYVAAFWLSSDDRDAAFKSTLKPLAAGALAGLAVVAVPLLMTVLFVSESNRPMISLAEAGRGSLHPASLLTLLIGDLYGALSPTVNYWGPFSLPWDPNELTLAQNMSQLYIGALPFLLVFTVGLTRGLAWEREVRFFAIAALAMLLYALGRTTPVFAFYYHLLPGVDLFRRPADATFLFGGILGVMGGYMVHRLVTRQVLAPTPGQRTAELLLPVAVLLAGIGVAVWLRHFNDAIRPLLAAAGWTLLCGTLVWALPRFMTVRPLAAIALPGLLLATDLAVNNGPNESTALPPERYAMLRPDGGNETVTELKKLLKQRPGSPRRDRVELVGLGFEWPNAAQVHGIDHLLGYNPLRLEAVTEAIGAGDTIAGADQRVFTPLFPSYRCLLADLLGLRFIATSHPVEAIDRRLRPGDLRAIGRTSDAYIYENPRAYPRVMFVPRAQRADFEAIIATGQWPRFDPSEVVLLEEEPQPLPAPTLRSPPGAARVRLESYGNAHVDVLIETPQPGYIVLNDIWHPWWDADVDGVPAEVLKANVLFRAVRVPAGRHRVHFEFHPLSGAFEELAEKLGFGDDKVALAPRH